MSPFMSSMPPAGLIEMPPVSNTTPLPTKQTGLALLGFGAMPLHDDDARGPLAALGHAQQRAHPELLELSSSRISTSRPRRANGSHALGELDRTQRIGRLVDEVAGEEHALGHRPQAGQRPLARRSGPRTGYASCVSLRGRLAVIVLPRPRLASGTCVNV